jgi:hypothetical protein
VLFAFIEVWIIRLAFGVDAFWEELHQGADLRVPLFFKFVIKWVTPFLLTGLLAWWIYDQAYPVLTMVGVPEENVGVIWLARLFLIGLLTLGCVLIGRAWSRKSQPQHPADTTARAR